MVLFAASLVASMVASAQGISKSPPLFSYELAPSATLPILPSKQPLKIGFVYVGPIGDGGWTYQHEQARRAVEEEFGDQVLTTRVESVPENQAADGVFRQLVERGNKLVFATTFGYMEPLARVAASSPPDVRFEHATGYRSTRNVRTYDARTYEGAYLAGIVAGHMTRADTLGVVAPIPIPEIIRNINAYTMGAQTANPKLRVKVRWVNSWFNPPAEASAAQSLIDSGVDTLFQFTDSAEVLKTAERNGKRAIGWDSDMRAYAPQAHLASSVVNWAPYYLKAVREAMNGTWVTGNTWWGVRQGAIDLVSLASDVPEVARRQVDLAKQQLRDGALSIWRGPIVDNHGRTVLGNGVIGDDSFLAGVNFYVRGVEGEIPGAKVAATPATGISATPPASVTAGVSAGAPGCNSSPAEVVGVKIGHVGPLSGPIAHLGQDNENGARMAIEDLNAKCLRIGGKVAQFELVPQDDAGDPLTGMRVAQRLVAMRVNGVVGHLNSGTTIPAAKLYQDAGIPQISPSATNPKYTRLGYKTAFRMLADDEALGKTLGRYAIEVAKGKRIAIIDDRTAYGSGVAAAFEMGALKSGGLVVRRDYVTDRSTEFALVVAQLKAARPDIVFYGGMDTVAGTLLKEIKRSGLDVKFMGGDGICTRDLVSLAGAEAVNDVVLCGEAGGVDEEMQVAINDFKRRYARRFGVPVIVYAPYVYDAVNVLAQAMVNAGSADPARYLRVLATSSYKGVAGSFAFDEKGDVRDGAITLYAYGGGNRTAVAVLH